MKIITFFNCRGKIGKTTMIYHLAHKFAEKGVRVLAVDLDPQAGLTEMFLGSELDLTIGLQNIRSAIEFKRELPHQSYLNEAGFSVTLNHNLRFLGSDMRLAKLENDFYYTWEQQRHEEVSIIGEIIKQECVRSLIDIVLIDTAPNFGSLNKTIFYNTNYLIVPAESKAVDSEDFDIIFDVVNDWNISWGKFDQKGVKQQTDEIYRVLSAGYLITRLNSSKIDLFGANNSEKILAQKYHRAIKSRNYLSYSPSRSSGDMKDIRNFDGDIYTDPYCLTILNYNPSLYQMSREAGKPMFHLTPADGAIGNHLNAVRQCSMEYDILAERINETCKLGLKL